MSTKLTDFLRERKDRIVDERELMECSWSPTYGHSDPTPITLQIVNFDRLLEQIDEFAATFGKGE